MERIGIVYGFDYECKIWKINTNGAILCKVIKTNLPVYAAPYIIEKTEISDIVKKINEIETTHPEIFENINTLAKLRSKQASWKIVLYGDSLTIDAGYESEGEEHGNGR